MSTESQAGSAAPPTNFCHDEGYLVSGEEQLFVDPVDYDVAGLPIRGCNQLRCPYCHAMVRNVLGRSFRGGILQGKPADLYALEELSTSPLLVENKGSRLYLCRCMTWVQSIGTAMLGDPDPDPFSKPSVSWKCDGHPIVELPRDIDGVEVTPQNVGDVAARSLRGILPPRTAKKDMQGGYWAARLHARLAKTPWQQPIVAAALACMDDLDFEARTRALHFFLCRNISAGVQRAVELLDGDRVLFADVPDLVMDAYKDQTLEHTLWLLAEPLVAQPGRARELAQAEALTPGKANYPLYFALAGGDPEWVAAHVDELVSANSGAVDLLATAIRVRFPDRIAKKPVLDRLQGSASALGDK